MVVDAVVDIVILEIGSVKLKMNFKSKCKRNWKIETTIVTVASPFVAVGCFVAGDGKSCCFCCWQPQIMSDPFTWQFPRKRFRWHTSAEERTFSETFCLGGWRKP